MLDWLKPKNDNEWTATDRRERRKMIATALIALLAVIGGVALLFVAITGH